jgi:hypothetical protein
MRVRQRSRSRPQHLRDQTGRASRYGDSCWCGQQLANSRLAPPMSKKDEPRDDPPPHKLRRSWRVSFWTLRISFGTRTDLASCQCRPCEPRPHEGDRRDKELPHGGSRRPCRALRGLLASETTVRISPSLGGRRGVPCDKITNKLGQSIRPLGQRRRTPEAVMNREGGS